MKIRSTALRLFKHSRRLGQCALMAITSMEVPEPETNQGKRFYSNRYMAVGYHLHITGLTPLIVATEYITTLVIDYSKTQPKSCGDTRFYRWRLVRLQEFIYTRRENFLRSKK